MSAKTWQWGWHRQLAGRLNQVRGWPVWSLPPLLRCYVMAVSCSGAAALAVAAALTPWRVRDAVIYLMLLGLGMLTIETMRRMGEPMGASKDANGAWQIAAAILLPPFYAIAAPMIALALMQAMVRRTLAFRRVFSAAAVGLAYGAASWVFHTVWTEPGLPSGQARLAGWLALAVGCAVLRYVINNGLVALALCLSDPAARVRDVIGGIESIVNDTAELCVGVLVALAAAVTPVALVIALPLGTVLQRSATYAQLMRASRLDAKTGLLTATAWRAEAEVQVTRARRADGKAGVAVAMIDVDHFKAVNDTYGHLAGDTVLVGIAEALTASLRPGDLAGRFGGEEFCVLFARADRPAALAIAERLRARLGEIAIPGEDEQAAGCVTVSIGVAALADCPGDLTDLLAAADSALYQAKQGGRNAVRAIGEPVR